MDHAQKPAEANDLPGQGPHLRLRTSEEQPADFIPLHLVLQPSGAVVEVTRPDVLIGRHSEADVRLPLPDVSRRHCRLQFVAGCWQVIDLNSLNGVQVNGEQVLQAPLVQGDLLRIGGFTFAVDLSRQTGASGVDGHVQSILKTLTTPQNRRAS
jgi:pSer/pThr/pTyr-binding forkhead associated (FHA) protein